MSEQFGEENNQISRFNDAGFSIQRLNQIWVMCRHYIKHGKLSSWKVELDNVWLELYPDIARQSNSDDLKKQNVKLQISISKSVSKNAMYFNLMRRHEFLRGLQDVAGKAGVYVDENEEGFE